MIYVVHHVVRLYRVEVDRLPEFVWMVAAMFLILAVMCGVKLVGMLRR